MTTLIRLILGVLEKVGLASPPEKQDPTERKGRGSDKDEDGDGSPGNDMYPLW